MYLCINSNLQEKNVRSFNGLTWHQKWTCSKCICVCKEGQAICREAVILNQCMQKVVCIETYTISTCLCHRHHSSSGIPSW